jgi:hypothetical protein
MEKGNAWAKRGGRRKTAEVIEGKEFQVKQKK